MLGASLVVSLLGPCSFVKPQVHQGETLNGWCCYQMQIKQLHWGTWLQILVERDIRFVVVVRAQVTIVKVCAYTKIT
jgi:hypothetical protein